MKHGDIINDIGRKYCYLSRAKVPGQQGHIPNVRCALYHRQSTGRKLEREETIVHLPPVFTAATLANSWDVELLEEWERTRLEAAEDVSLLGPGININFMEEILNIIRRVRI